MIIRYINGSLSGYGQHRETAAAAFPQAAGGAAESMVFPLPL
jgi:hypothetical protein